MKRIIFSFLLLIVQLTLCQNNPQIQNGDFENWTKKGTFHIADNWCSDDNITFQFCPSSDAYSGKTALIISTWYSYVPGNLFYGVHTDPLVQNWTDYTVPFDGKPQKLTGYYKYTDPVNPTDQAGGKIIIKGDSKDTLAYGEKLFDPISQWTYFEIPLKYFSTNTAKSIAMFFTSREKGNGMNRNNEPNWLYLDELKFIY